MSKAPDKAAKTVVAAPSTVRQSTPPPNDVTKGAENKMFMNGNYYGGYYPNRYLPYASTSAQTASVSSDPPPPALSNGTVRNHQNNVYNANNHATISDTVAMAGDDLSNVPAAVIIQLERANRTIAAQTLEIERLKSFQNQNIETHMLRKQINGLESEMRTSRERFLEQQELMAEMNREIDNLVKEKVHIETKCQEMERKYKKAKFASRELAKILENDLCGTPTTSKAINGFESDDETNDTTHESLFHRSRTLSRQQESNELKAKAERAIEQAQQRKQNQEVKESRLLMERVLGDNENLLIELDRERRMTESLQNDLEKSRRLVIDRDETIEDLRGKLGKAEAKATQCESDLSRTSTDLALERARCDALTLELHELDAIFNQTQSTVQAFAIENEQLEEKCRDAHRTIITLNAKLEAQGIDLVTTKRTLRTLRETTEQRSGPF